MVVVGILGADPVAHLLSVAVTGAVGRFTPAIIDGGAVGLDVSGVEIALLAMAAAPDSRKGDRTCAIAAAATFGSVLGAAEALGAVAHDPVDATLGGIGAAIGVMLASSVAAGFANDSRRADVARNVRRLRFTCAALGAGAGAAVLTGHAIGFTCPIPRS